MSHLKHFEKSELISFLLSYSYYLIIKRNKISKEYEKITQYVVFNDIGVYYPKISQLNLIF